MSAFGPLLWDLEESVTQADRLQEWWLSGRPCVYFISAGWGSKGRTKIGKCTGHPRERMAQLQTGSATPLRLEAFIAGGLEKEREFHEVTP